MKLLTALLQVDSFLMEKKEMIDVNSFQKKPLLATCRVSAVALAYNHLIFSLREQGPIRFQQQCFKPPGTILRHKCLVRFHVQESPTNNSITHLIVIAMNKNKCRMME